MLSEESKSEVVLILSVGCDRETAAKYVGCRLDELHQELAADQGFAGRVRRAEAGCELAHMRCVHQASRDEKHWRASVWWLERQRPERYARREPGAIGSQELVTFLGALAGDLADVLDDQSHRERALEAVARLSKAMGDPLAIEEAPR